ncbi:hypothetical protein [Isachenkonia alkalipeptolytica]|uniref:Uncharacterized protein n=1 Tax=Isachenkonia alkalipeptolytica TaxID=2565777 RepID=A0AA43XK31_9CLOT|nr:hypothetical protein [Isachenkonia alkalipeptolytica]NBG87739.1 hypothetical protein [Isachenkonia alkalipeptolytica]
MGKRVTISTIAILVLILVGFGVVSCTGESNNQNLTVSIRSYEEVPERVQESIDEMFDRMIAEDRDEESASMSWGETQYHVLVPGEGRAVEILEMGEDEAKGRGKKVVYTFVEQEGSDVEEEIQRFKEDMVIIEVENYQPGHFTLTKRGS